MAIAYTRTRADLTGPVAQYAGYNVTQTFYAIIDITTAAVATDSVTLGYLPKGAIPVGGYFSAADIDTGTEVLDMDVGIAANGVDSVDTDFFMNGGVFTGDAFDDVDSMGVLTNASNWRPIVGPFPVTQLGAKTAVTLLTNTAANAGGTGKVVVCIHYITPGASTS